MKLPYFDSDAFSIAMVDLKGKSNYVYLNKYYFKLWFTGENLT